MPILSLSILGPFSSTVGGSSLTKFRTRSVQALLVYLAVEGRTGGVIQREYLAEMLYPGLPPASSKKNLRQTLYELRQMIAATAAEEEPLLVADRQTMALNQAWTIDLDASRFESGAKSEEPDRLEQAAVLYRGDFLNDFYLPDSGAFESWAAERRAYYRRLAVSLFDRLAETFLASEAYAQAEGYARRQLVLDDLNEPAVRQLMRALAAQDQRSPALAEFKGLQQRLVEELAIEPAPETFALFRIIQAGELAMPGGSLPQQAVPGAEVTAGESAPTGPVVVHNLPAQPTPFVGRQEELAEIGRLLDERSNNRLITLLGQGGSGKSRLALEAGSRLVKEKTEAFPDGIWFVPLAALSNADSVVTEVAQRIGMRFTGTDVLREQQLADFLAKKKLLLILDNYEHLLLNKTLPLPATILSQAADVSMLVTTRARLNVRGEQFLPITGLTLPEEATPFDAGEVTNFSAIALFVQSSTRVRADFELDETNWPEIVRICRMVEGLPLGIELAATWMEILTPEEIAAEIKHSLDFLSAEYSDIPERQRSMRAVFNASWQLLSTVEQQTIQRLSVCRGAFSREAAAAVASADIRMLLALVSKSWLLQEQVGDYQLHELLRQYSQEKLNVEPVEYRSARRDHAIYFAKWLEGLGNAVRSHGQKEALEAVAGSFENIRLAWAWLAVEGEISTLTRQMLPALVRFCGVRSRGQDMLAMVGAAQSGISKGRLKSLDAAILEVAGLAFTQGLYAPQFLEGGNLGYEIPAEPIERIWLAFEGIDARQVDGVWPTLAAVFYAWDTKRDLESMARLQELAAAYEQAGNDWSRAFVMKYLGLIQGSPFSFKTDESMASASAANLHTYNRQVAARLLRRAASIFKKIGDQLEQADSLRILGGVFLFHEPELSIGPWQQAKTLFEESGDLVMVADISAALGFRSLWLGDFEEGFASFREGRLALEAMGYRQNLAHACAREAIHALRYSGIDHARQLRLQCRTLYTDLGLTSDLAWTLWELGNIERVAGHLELALEYFRQAHQLIEQENMPFGRIFYALGLGDYSLAISDSRAAIEYFQESLSRSVVLNHHWAKGYALNGLARAYMSAERLEEAESSFLEALEYTQEIGQNNPLSMISLAGLANLRYQTGELEQALLLAVFVDHYVVTWLETRGQAQEVMAAATGQLSVETVKAIRQQGSSMTKGEILEMVFTQENSREE